jgi:hypothetical protein
MPRNRAASDLRFFVGGPGLAAVVLFPVLLGSPLAASQTPAAEEPPAPVAAEPFSDTVDVRIVNVEVVVTDADGNPVTGLTRAKTRRFDLPIKIPAARALEAMAQVATYPLELKMNRGRKRIAIGVHDHLGNESSVIRYEIVLGEDEDPGKRSRS